MFLSYQPSNLELGMLWRAKVKNVYFAKSLSPLEIGQYKVTQDGCELVDNPDFSPSPPTKATKQFRRGEITSHKAVKNALHHPIKERTIPPSDCRGFT